MEKEIKIVTDEDGTLRYYLNGKLHREDGPAIEYGNGDKFWYINGKRHREDGPAVEYDNGDKYWYINGKLHRADGPAVECTNGDKFWIINGKRHREDGPAIEDGDGDKKWYINGKLHRADGPAVECTNGDKYWYINDKLHREDGPAIEDGDKKWYINGEKLTEEEFNKLKIKNNLNVMKDLVVDKPLNYVPKKNNRYLVEFPKEFKIESWTVKKINNPKYTNNTWEDIKVEFIDLTSPSTSQGLYRLFEFLTNNKNNEVLFDIKIQLVDAIGVVIEQWIISVEKVLTINFGDLDYSDDGMIQPYLILKPFNCVLDYKKK
jgi:hypothetical protein